MYPRQAYNDLAMLQNQLNQQRGFQSQQPNMSQQQQQQSQSQLQPQQASNASLLAQQIHAAAAVANQHKQQQQQQQPVLGANGTPLQQATQLNNPQGRSITPISLVSGSVPVTSTTTSSSVNHSLTQTPDIPTVTTATSSTNAAGITGGNTQNTTNNKALNDEMVYSWIVELAYGPNKEEALLELGKKREFYDDLALVLWNSFGVMSSLLSEIVSVYPVLSPPNLTTHASNRVCNALALLQCVASHPDTRTAFLHTQIPLFLYPFLNTSSKQRPYEYLRLTSLGVIGALVKNDTPDVIQFLLTTEIIPLCLKIMETSSELNKTVAIFIVQKILIDDAGLAYVCQTYDRFEAVSKVLNIMIEQLVTAPTARLLRHVIRCYLRLSDNPEARNALKEKLPQALKDETFANVMKEDPPSKTGLAQLLQNLQA